MAVQAAESFAGRTVGRVALTSDAPVEGWRYEGSVA